MKLTNAQRLQSAVLRLNENEDFKVFLEAIREARESAIQTAIAEADQGLDSKYALGMVAMADHIDKRNDSIREEALRNLSKG